MKKRLVLWVSLLVIVLVFTLFGNEMSKDGVLVCTNTIKNDSVDMVTKYQISYKNRYVTKVKSVEKITTDDSQMLNNYELLLNSMYSNYKNLKYYSNKITINKNMLTSITNIDYEHIDVNKFTAIDRNNRNLFDNGKVKISKIKKMYQKTGARCR